MKKNKTIPSKDYITISKYGVFVGGNPAKTYRGSKIQFMDRAQRYFAAIQKQNPEVQELHVGVFITPGEEAKPGNPSSSVGKHVWGRVKLSGGYVGPWVLIHTYRSASGWAGGCAVDSVEFIYHDTDVRSAMLNSAKTNAAEKIDDMLNKLETENQRLQAENEGLRQDRDHFKLLLTDVVEQSGKMRASLLSRGVKKYKEMIQNMENHIKNYNYRTK